MEKHLNIYQLCIFYFIFKYRKVKSQTDPRHLGENSVFQKNQSRIGEYTSEGE